MSGKKGENEKEKRMGLIVKDICSLISTIHTGKTNSHQSITSIL
jgi:hypothetical protein